MSTGTAGTSKGKSQAGGAGAEVQADVVPELVDDGGPDIEATETQLKSLEQEAGELEAGLKPPKIDTEAADRRDSIAERYRKKREEEAKAATEGDTETVSDGENDSPESANANSDGDGNAAAAATDGKTDASEQQPRKFKLKVDGAEEERNEQEVLELAQKYLAGNSRLESSKEVLKELKSLRDQITANQRGTGESAATSSADPSTAVDPNSADQTAIDEKQLADLEDRVNRMQTGDAKEGAQAMLEVMRDLGKTIEGNLRKTQAATIKQVTSEERVAEEIKGAVSKFREDYPEIIGKPLIHEATGTAVKEELIKDLKEAGATDADLKPIAHDARLLAVAHQRMRQGGNKIRSYDEVLGSAAGRIAKEFNLPLKKLEGQKGDEGKTTPGAKPAQAKPAAAQPGAKNGNGATPQRIVVNPEEAQRRVDLKRNQQQPKTAGGRVPAQQQQRPKTVREVIADMRRDRKVYPVNR